MFCSNCGKSLDRSAAKCPHCGMTVGESRFESNRGYTGAQTKLRPGQAVRVPNTYGNHYTTDFTVESDRKKEEVPSDVDSGYRAVPGAGISGYGEDDDREPLFNSEEPAETEPETEPEEPQAEEPAENEEPKRPSLRSLFFREANKAAQEAQEEVPLSDSDEITEEEMAAIRPEEAPPAAPAAGISEEVRSFMTRLREEYDRKDQEAKRKEDRKTAKRMAMEEEGEGEEFPAETEPDDEENEEPKPEKKKEKKEKKEKEDKKASKEKAKKSKPKKEKPPKPKQIKKRKVEEDFDDLDDDEDETLEEAFEKEYEDEFTDESIGDDLRREKRLRVLRYILAALTLVLVVCLAIWGLNRISENTKTAPVEEVTPELWDSGIQVMQERVGSSYRRSMLAKYDTNDPSTFTDLYAAMTSDLDSLSELMPASPLRNDSRFINALKAIQENINNCLTNDALALTDTSKTKTQKDQESEARWQIVRDLVTQLTRSTNTGMLDAIIKQERVELIAQATPEPEPTPTPEPYTTLAKGSTGPAVTNLQARLTELGYLNSAIDGDYGNKTKTAVQKFQERAGLKATGIADVETQEKLFAPDAPKSK